MEIFFSFLFIRQQSILSDEEAREVEELLAQRQRENSVSSQSNESQSKIPTKDDVQPHKLQQQSSTEETRSNSSTDSKSQPPPLPSQPPRIKSVRQTSITSVKSDTQSNESIINDLTKNSTINDADDTKPIPTTHRVEYRRLIDSRQGSNSSLTDPDQYFIPEYPPISPKEVFNESGVHYFEDGNFWMEIPGLLECDDDDDDDLDYPVYKVCT